MSQQYCCPQIQISESRDTTINKDIINNSINTIKNSMATINNSIDTVLYMYYTLSDIEYQREYYQGLIDDLRIYIREDLDYYFKVLNKLSKYYRIFDQLCTWHESYVHITQHTPGKYPETCNICSKDKPQILVSESRETNVNKDTINNSINTIKNSIATINNSINTVLDMYNTLTNIEGHDARLNIQEDLDYYFKVLNQFNRDYRIFSHEDHTTWHDHYDTIEFYTGSRIKIPRYEDFLLKFDMIGQIFLEVSKLNSENKIVSEWIAELESLEPELAELESLASENIL